MPWIRYNDTTKLYEIAATEGGAYTNLALDAGQIVQGRLVLPNASNSQIALGTLEFQGFADRNVLVNNNVYYDGAWKLRTTGYGNVFQMVNGVYYFMTAPTGTGGTTPTLANILALDRGDAAIPYLATFSGPIRERGRTAGIGEWITYTPSWTSQSNPQPSLGNGTLSGRYSRLGKTVFFDIWIFHGSTTTWGTGVLYWSLPITANGTLYASTGTVFSRLGGGGTPYFYSGVCQIYDTSKIAIQYNTAAVGAGYGSGNFAGATTLPNTPGAGDYIYMSGKYVEA